MKYYVFPCGCKFPIINEELNRVEFDARLENIPLDCERTWDLISEGNTKGVFQLESRLGQMLAKKLKPRTIEHLAALISIMRPGCISGDTKITLRKYPKQNGSYGYVTIPMRKLYEQKDKYIKKNIISLDEESGKLVNNRIVDVIHKGNQPVYSLQFKKLGRQTECLNQRKGFQLKCTDDHPVLTPTGWLLVRDLKPGDRFAIIKYRGKPAECSRERYKLPQYPDIEWAMFTGKTFVEYTEVYDISVLGPNHNFIAGNVVVHNCLEAIRDGKSVTDHYIDRKNGVEPVEIFHPSLQPALGATYGEMIYQEQAMRIAQDVAGFNLQQADVLRKAIGKKKPEIMAKVKKEFLEGVEKTGVMPLDQAELVFGWIEKSQRYSFNKSHAVSYAINGYLTAYAKAHFPRSFFTSYLYFAKEKTKPQEEISELANNAKMMDIEVYPPDFRYMNKHFRLVKKNIYFGFADIKNVGESVISRMEKRAKEVEAKLGRGRETWSWLEILVHLTPYINSAAVTSIISAGGFSYTGVPRTAMLFEYETYNQLSQREQHWAEANLAGKKGILDLFQAIVDAPTGKDGACANKNRKEKVMGYLETLKKPPMALTDTPEWIAMVEERVMGLPITCTVVDGCKTEAANCTVRDFVKGYNGMNGVILLACKIDDVKEIKTKNGKAPGQKMAFFTVSDGSGSYDGAVVFPKQWKELRQLITVGNTVLLNGKRGKDRDGLIVDKAWQI